MTPNNGCIFRDLLKITFNSFTKLFVFKDELLVRVGRWQISSKCKIN